MIKLVNVTLSEASSALYLKIQLDAEAADIHNQKAKAKAEQCIGKKLVTLSNAIRNGAATDGIEQGMREFFRERFFRHFVDVISINDFIYDMRVNFIKYKKNIALAGYETTFEFLNYVEKEH